VRLVRRLIGREANVAINAFQRSAVRFRISLHPRTDLAQTKLEVSDESKARLADQCFVAMFIFQEPWTPVIPLQLAKEAKHLAVEVGLRHLDTTREGLTAGRRRPSRVRPSAEVRQGRPLARCPCSPGPSTPCWA